MTMHAMHSTFGIRWKSLSELSSSSTDRNAFSWHLNFFRTCSSSTVFGSCDGTVTVCALPLLHMLLSPLTSFFFLDDFLESNSVSHCSRTSASYNVRSLDCKLSSLLIAMAFTSRHACLQHPTPTSRTKILQ